MIALDTNVVLRYLLEDDDDQSSRAAALINDRATRGERMYLAHIVLCEVTWVLKAGCALSKGQIVAVLTGLLRTAQFVVEEPDLARRALRRYEQGSADFADYLIAERANAAGCDQLATFDRQLLREDGFVAP